MQYRGSPGTQSIRTQHSGFRTLLLDLGELVPALLCLFEKLPAAFCGPVNLRAVCRSALE